MMIELLGQTPKHARRPLLGVPTTTTEAVHVFADGAAVDGVDQ